MVMVELLPGVQDSGSVAIPLKAGKQPVLDGVLGKRWARLLPSSARSLSGRSGPHAKRITDTQGGENGSDNENQDNGNTKHHDFTAGYYAEKPSPFAGGARGRSRTTDLDIFRCIAHDLVRSLPVPYPRIDIAV